jgi:hypothetical protein
MWALPDAGDAGAGQLRPTVKSTTPEAAFLRYAAQN